MKKQHMKHALLGTLTAVLVSGTQVQAQRTPFPTASGIAQRKSSKLSADLAAVAQKATPTLTQVPELSVASEAQVFDGYVVIEAVAVAVDASALLSDLQARGLKNGAAYGAMVSGLFPVANLASLEGVSSLRHARPAYAPAKNVGAVTSQGDVALKSDLARTKYRVTGAGVKVGILSDSYNNLNGAAAGVASGDLPDNVQVLEDFPSGGSDEGRGMAELVHDVAPGAAIAFHTAFLGQASFAQGIEDLQRAGCRIIVDDVINLAEPFFENGIIAQAAERVVDRGSAYFSSAGNQAQRSYEAPYANSGQVVAGTEGAAHAFAPGDVRQAITIAPGGSLLLALQWTDAFFSANGRVGAKTDIDMYLYFNGALVASSAANNLGGDPFEFISLSNNSAEPLTVELVITKFAGPDPKLLKYVNYGNTPRAVEYDTRSSTLIGHANAEKVIAVGASAYFNTPLFNPNTPVPLINGFSSLGGTPIYYDRGKELVRPRVFQKPEITGPDGANTSFFPLGGDIPNDADAFPNFFGTSASAPHVAAVGALMIEGVAGYLRPAQIKEELQASAIDMNNPLTPGPDAGFDFKTGFGFVQADRVFAQLEYRLRRAPLTAVATSSAKGGGGQLAAGETSVFPNPSTGAVTFNVVAQENQAISVRVLDLSGREVFRAKGTQRLALTQDLSALPKGMYITQFDVEGQASTQKLIIQ